jgi:hypothetical protein
MYIGMCDWGEIERLQKVTPSWLQWWLQPSFIKE